MPVSSPSISRQVFHVEAIAAYTKSRTWEPIDILNLHPMVFEGLTAVGHPIRLIFPLRDDVIGTPLLSKASGRAINQR